MGRDAQGWMECRLLPMEELDFEEVTCVSLQMPGFHVRNNCT